MANMVTFHRSPSYLHPEMGVMGNTSETRKSAWEMRRDGSTLAYVKTNQALSLDSMCRSPVEGKAGTKDTK